MNEDDLDHIPAHKLCVICTGSQGEQFAGLNRLAYNAYERLRLGIKDTVVFSSRSIPGNERAIGQMINQLARIGCRVITSKEKLVHVSGHGYQDDLKACIMAAKPKYFFPVHGELRHLKQHALLAQECGVPKANCFVIENGGVISLTDKQPGIVGTVPAGRTYVTIGYHMEQAGGELLKQRLNMGKHGAVDVAVVLQKKGFELIAKPIISVKGVPIKEKIIAERFNQIRKKVIADGLKKKTYSDSVFQEDLRIEVRKFVESQVGFKTVVSILMTRLPA